MAHRNFDDSGPCDSTQSSSVEEHLSVMEDTRETIDYKNCVALLCAKCNIVLGDSLGICGEVKDINSIICFKVTNDVKVSGKFEACIDGPLAMCTYQMLECRCCHRFVGVVLYATPQNWSFLRNYFLLRKDVLNCYLLKNSTTVKARNISFENRSLREQIDELKQELEALLKQVDILKDMVADVNIQTGGELHQTQSEESLSFLY